MSRRSGEAVEGYYDYHPTLTLPRPLALAGFFGSGTAEVAAIVSQRTGLAVVELDRWIEHEAGSSLAELVWREGEERLREIESRLLPRALAQQPPALVALGDGALLRDENRRLVLEAADLMYLREVPAVLLSRVREEVRRAPGSMYPFIGNEPASVADLAGLLADREPGYRKAPLMLDVGGRSTSAVARELLSLLRSRAA
jgi:shikimate kinase